MLRHPVMISSLEEDFKQLGLLSEEGEPSAPQEKAPPGVPAMNKASGSRNVGAMSDDPDEDGEPGVDEVPGHEGEEQPHQNLPVTPGAQAESIAGMPDKVRGAGGGKSKEADDDEDDDDGEDEVEKDESVGLEGSSLVAEAIRSLREGRKTRKVKTESRQAASSGFDKVTSLIEDVNTIMESIDDRRRHDAVKAFANTSIIADMLSRGFAQFAESYESAELGNTAEAFGQLSKDAALVAEALEEGEEIEAEALQSEFRDQMNGLIEGLDLYSDIIESEVDEATAVEDDEEGDEDDDKDDEKKSKKSDDDDDDKDDEKDEDDDQEEAVEYDEEEQAEALFARKMTGGKAQKSRVAGNAGAAKSRWSSGGIVASKDEEAETQSEALFTRKPLGGKAAKGSRAAGSAGAAKSRWSAGGIVSSKSEAYLPFGKSAKKPMVNRPPMKGKMKGEAGY